MLGINLATAVKGGADQICAYVPPSQMGWDSTRFPVKIRRTAGTTGLDPRSLVDPAIWSGPAYHVDEQTGDDNNTGLGSADGDFANAKRTIHAAFTAGNATNAAYRVIVKPGEYAESAFTQNGNVEPNQPVAIVGWGGMVTYRTGPFTVTWTADGTIWQTAVSAVRRVFRTDVTDGEGRYTELNQVADVATCSATNNSWSESGGIVHVNIGKTPGSRDLALIRSFHGARLLTHTDDLYLENIAAEGGISGALHVDAVASRNVVAKNCSFRYSAPSNPALPFDAVLVRQTDGLVAFFDCDASYGAEDGWSFHEDLNPGMHVIMENCSGMYNGAGTAQSCNALTAHDAIRLIDISGSYGHSRNGTDVHVIQATRSWMLGTQVIARDPDGSSTAFKCSNQAILWLQNAVADADGATSSTAIEAAAGEVRKRNVTVVSGTEVTTSGGEILFF